VAFVHETDLLKNSDEVGQITVDVANSNDALFGGHAR